MVLAWSPMVLAMKTVLIKMVLAVLARKLALQRAHLLAFGPGFASGRDAAGGRGSLACKSDLIELRRAEQSSSTKRAVQCCAARCLSSLDGHGELPPGSEALRSAGDKRPLRGRRRVPTAWRL
ncbi:hypothetical protein NDU88_001895 [Pleurodeles waltl]|uniref:Secreted protein n=1 Tax=Pleurodeles waltl TaxID=8319 RepID=A0AAV7U9D7_PLEWA|nr:hypothetical protein NDU88_001895 [Pleurodeles waltl]